MMLEFGDMFEAVTGNKPMAWQCRLYDQFLANDIKPVIDLPTGMGKTSVMAIWLIARAKQIEEKRTERLPTRLVYVVDRRTVVDQATDLAQKLVKNAKEAKIVTPAISTLRVYAWQAGAFNWIFQAQTLGAFQPGSCPPGLRPPRKPGRSGEPMDSGEMWRPRPDHRRCRTALPVWTLRCG